MRHLFLLAGLLLPELAFAQFSKEFKPGSYTLIAGNGTSQVGNLSFRGERKLLVETPAGKRLKLTPGQVHNFRIGDRSYTVAKDFRISVNSHDIDVEAAFVEQLDSGKVVLTRYDHLINTGANWLYLYRYPVGAYVIRNHSDSVLAVVVDYFNQSVFRQKARPSLVTRPDLVQLLDQGYITYNTLPRAIHALNNNSPFSTSAPLERKE